MVENNNKLIMVLISNALFSTKLSKAQFNKYDPLYNSSANKNLERFLSKILKA